MATEIKLPDLGEGVEGGDVIQVLVAAGDTVEAEQTILEVETEKAALDVPCTTAGKVTEVRVKEGDHIEVGQILLIVDESGGAEAEQEQEQEQEQEEASPEPEEEPAEEAEEEEPAEEAPAGKEKAAEKKPAEKAGKKAGKTEKKAEKKAEKKPEKKAEKPPEEPEKKKPAPADQEDREPIPAGPGTRRLARELGVDLRAVAQARPDERITEELIKEYVKQRMAEPAPQRGASAGPAPVELPDFSQWGPVERVAFSSLQRKTAHQLLAGWQRAPHVTQFDKADVTTLEALRKRYSATEQGQQIRLTVTAFVLKAVAIALKEFPKFNASLDESAGELVYKKYYHLGMAVDTEAGLIVPVLRDVDRKPILQIASEMNAMADRTRQRKVSLDELRGGTFTVTNLGGLGGTGFTPVINYPEVAILGLARSHQEPVWSEGQWAPRLMMPLCLSYDHRVINGADGVRFIRKLVTLLEDPEMLLLGGG